MNLKIKYDLLDIILKNGSINRLTREGVELEQIADFINILTSENFIEYKNEKIKLTSTGLKELKKLEIIFKKTTKSEWILPDEKNRIAKLEKSFIFVPKQNELLF